MATTYDPILAGIVRILNTHDQIVGTGFLISHSPERQYGLIATSTRVIEQVTASPIEQSLQETIPLIFEHDASKTRWNGSIQSWSSSAREDVSILRIEGDLPKQVRTLPLSLATTTEGRRVTLFGYPTNTSDFRGAWVYCDTCRPGPRQVKTEFPFLQLDSPLITDGYSGAPVWDDARRRVIGLVTQVVSQDAQEKSGEHAYAAPIELLQRVYNDVLIKFSSPYHGLAPFTESDTASFFGYDDVLNRMTQKLHDEIRFLAVLGPIGSGKSSVVRAGLLGKLQHGEVRGHTEWGIFLVRLSSNDPFQQLEAEGLKGASVHLSNGIHVWSQRNSCQRLVFILDQFEQVLHQCPHETQRRFVEQLVEVIDRSVATVILVLKDEFYTLLAKHEALMKWVETSLVNIFPPHTKEELLNIARKRAKIPGAIKDFKFIEEVINKIIDQNQTKKNNIIGMYELCLTQVTHYQDEAKKLGQDINAENLLRCIEAGLDGWAESIFDKLDGQQQACTQRLFIQLILLGDESQGIPDTGRQIQITTFCEKEPDFESAYKTIYHLADKELLTTDRDPSTGHERVSIAQDNLIHEWQRYKQWLQEYREFLLWQKDFELRKSLCEASLQGGKDDEDVLLHEFVLTEAEMWLAKRPADFNQQSQDFIRASQKRKQQKELALREQKHQAVLAHHLMAQSALLYTQHPDQLQQAVSLAAESHARTPSPEADYILRQGLALLPRPVTCISFQGDKNVTAFSRDGRYVAVACGNSVEISELATGQRCFRFSHTAPILALDFDHHTHYLFTLTTRGLVSVWTMSNSILLSSYQESTQITVATFSPDGRFLAVASIEGAGGVIKVWETNPWRSRCRFSQPSRIDSVAFNHTGQLLATGHSNGIVTVWDIERKSTNCYAQMQGMVTAISFSLGGQYLAVASEKGIVGVLDVKAKSILLQANLSTRPILTFSPQGEYLVVGCDDSSARIWAIPSGSELAQFTDHRGPVLAAAFSFDSKYLATASNDKTAYIYCMDNYQQVMRINHEKAVRNLAFSMDNRYLFTASDDQTVRVWEIVKGKDHLLLPHQASISIIACTMQGTLLRVATGCVNGDVRVWNIQQRYQENGINLPHQGRVRAITFSPDGHYLATASDNHEAYLWDTTSDYKEQRLCHSDAVYTIAFRPDSRYIVTGSEDGSVRVWETANGQVRGCLTHSSAINAVYFHQRSGTIIIASSDGTIQLWEWERGSAYHPVTPAHKSSVNAIAVSNDERYLASASEDQSICLWIWNGSSYKLHYQQFHEGPVHAVCFSIDGQYLASAGEDHCARLWDTASGTERFSFPHESAVWTIAFTPDGRYLATASRDGTASIWETITGRQIIRLTDISSVQTLSFSPDGKYLITGSSDKHVRVWLWQANDLAHEAITRVTHTLTQEEWQQFVGNDPYQMLYSDNFGNRVTNTLYKYFPETVVETEIQPDQSDENDTKYEKLEANVQQRMHAMYEDVNAGRTENLQTYFDAAAHFSRYSVRNQLLILEQLPEATYVLGPKTWEKHGYTVKKGEQGIAIRAPYHVGETTKKSFKWIDVWDISQVQPIDEQSGEALSLSLLSELETTRHGSGTVDQERVKHCIERSIRRQHRIPAPLAEPVEYIAMRHFGLSREMPTAFVPWIAGRSEKEMLAEIKRIRDLTNETINEVREALKSEPERRRRTRHMTRKSNRQVHRLERPKHSRQ